MKLRSVLPMKVAKYGSILISLLFCVVGVLLILLPPPSEAMVGIFFGITMLIFGIIKLVGYFSKDLFRLAFQYDLQFGILLIILGILTLIKQAEAVEFIRAAYCVCMLADCLFKIRIAWDAKAFGIRPWWLTLALAVISGIMSILLAVFPAATMKGISVFLGLSLLSEGILSLSVAVSMIKIIDHQQPDVIQVDDFEVWEEK